MIVDSIVRANIQQEWAGIIALTKWSRGSAIPGGVYLSETPPESFFCLPLVLAYSTLDHVLGQFLDEKLFPCISGHGKNRLCRNLGDKMQSAKAAIHWHDFDLVEKGREARNGIAHDNVLVEKSWCLKYIDAVGAELRGWGLL